MQNKYNRATASPPVRGATPDTGKAPNSSVCSAECQELFLKPCTAQLLPAGVVLQPLIHRTPSDRWQLCPAGLLGSVIQYCKHLLITPHNFPITSQAKRDRSAQISLPFPPGFPHLASLLVNPLLLHKVPVGVGEAGVVGQGSQPLLLQDGCGGVALVPGQAVDYPRVICQQGKRSLNCNSALFPVPAQPAKQILPSPRWNKDKSKDITASLENLFYWYQIVLTVFPMQCFWAFGEVE